MLFSAIIVGETLSGGPSACSMKVTDRDENQTTPRLRADARGPPPFLMWLMRGDPPLADARGPPLADARGPPPG